MHRMVSLLLPLVFPLALTACGGSKSGPAVTVTCSSGTAVVGATSVDLSADPATGRPLMNFPDPANPGKTGSIALEPRGRCTITPTQPG